MAKVRYANTARINRKPDGSIVVSLYVNESKEYFNKAVARARTARTTATRRKVKISKTDKERHREKIKISGYLEANQWEYVLRVPVPNNNHAAVWRSFTEKYRYRHKYAPLQYLMIKGAGELYGVISNAPVEDGKIPMVDIEHEVLGVFNVSMIGAMERMTLQYNRTGTDKAYMNSKGLNKKTYDYINLDNIEQFELPDDALLTVGQASIVFDGGTAEENEKAVQQFLSEKKVQKLSSGLAKKYNDVKELVKDKDAMKELYFEFRKNVSVAMKNDYVKNVGVYDTDNSKFEYIPTMDDIENNNIQIDVSSNSIMFKVEKDNTIVWSARWLVGEKNWDELRWNTFPVVYYWYNVETGELIYVGRSITPITRHTDHFARNKYKNRNEDGVYDRYIEKKGVSADKLKALYLPVGYYIEPNEYTNSKGESSFLYDGKNPKIPYVTLDDDGNEKIQQAEARIQNRLIKSWDKGLVLTDNFLGVCCSDVLKAEVLFFEHRKKGKSIEEAAKDVAALFIPNHKKRDRLFKYLKYNALYKRDSGDNDPLQKCMDWWGAHFEQREYENIGGFSTLDAVIDVLRKDRFGLEDMMNNVIAPVQETAEQRKNRHETMISMWEKENDMSMIDGWIPE